MTHQLQANSHLGNRVVRILLILVFSPFLFEPPP
jgi:hypothetical protein